MTSVKLPDGIISIGDFAFSGRHRLVSIEIPNNVRYIGAHAFSGCEKLTSLTVPGRVEFIGQSAFSHCTDLKNVELLDGILLIENWFSSSPVKSITIPASVKMVGALPIEGLGEGKRLEEVVYGGSKEEWYDVYTAWDSLNMYMEYLRLKVTCGDGEIRLGGGWQTQE